MLETSLSVAFFYQTYGVFLEFMSRVDDGPSSANISACNTIFSADRQRGRSRASHPARGDSHPEACSCVSERFL